MSGRLADGSALGTIVRPARTACVGRTAMINRNSFNQAWALYSLMAAVAFATGFYGNSLLGGL